MHQGIQVALFGLERKIQAGKEGMKLWTVAQTKQVIKIFWILGRVIIRQHIQMLQIKFYNFTHGDD
jgi:hypothetical protein